VGWLFYAGCLCSRASRSVDISASSTNGVVMSCKSPIVIAAILMGTAFASGAAQASNLLLNGGFESPPSPGSASYLDYTSGQSIQTGGGWTVLDNSVDVVDDQGPYAITPHSGSQLVDLVGVGSLGGIYQSFATTSGQSYSLTFWYGNNPTAGSAAAAVEVGDSAGSTTDFAGSVSHSGSTGSNVGWTEYTTSFAADSSLTYLSFDTTIGSNNGGIVLDDVVVSPNVAATPLPSTWTMLIAGFVGLGFFAYRGAKNNPAALAAA
jgi:choice-of-anchor C domain-containing protein